MRIMIDLDGTIAELKRAGQTYKTVRPNPGAREKLIALKKAGHYIILQTARHMKTCDGDQGKVVAKVGKDTLDWLAEHKIPYDEIYFGKPYADVYLDDLAHTFTNWDTITLHGFDTEHINVLIPMAGAGSRFAKAGYTDPKPLISAKGKTLIEWSMESFSFLLGKKNVTLIFVVLREHDQVYGLKKQLLKLFGKTAQVIIVESVPEGQAASCLAARSLIDSYNQLIIYNCDTYTTGNEKLFELVENERPDGILACFKSTNPRYSYARVDKTGYVDLVKEKEVISNHASTGLYYFRRGSDFVHAADALHERGEKANGEYYVAPCYNELLKSGKKIKTYTVKENWVIGTPEELEVFKKNFS